MNVDFDPIVKTTNYQKYPKKPGVYIGLNGEKGDKLNIVYVGETKNLRRRLRRHPDGASIYFSFEVMENDSESERKKREKELIERFAPGDNIQHADSVRGWNEEWVIRYNEDGTRELWKEPDSLAKEGDTGYFKPKKIRDLGKWRRNK